MKKSLLLFLLALISWNQPQAANKSKSVKLRVATFNIRLETKQDTAARSWENRKTAVASVINKYDFDVFGVQEVGSLKQEADLKALIPGYTFFGKGRDNADGTAGERLGVFFKTDRFTLGNKGYFFLSATPDSVSFGWDAACRRICLWTQLTDKQTGKSFYIFCTHFDHVGEKARVESAKLILDRIQKIAGNAPVLCVGDLNTSPLSAELYRTLTTSLKDSRIITITPPKGSLGTFNGYTVNTDSFPESALIDYILSQRFKINSYQVITDRYSEFTYPSDHFPVMVECEIEK